MNFRHRQGDLGLTLLGIVASESALTRETGEPINR